MLKKSISFPVKTLNLCSLTPFEMSTHTHFSLCLSFCCVCVIQLNKAVECWAQHLCIACSLCCRESNSSNPADDAPCQQTHNNGLSHTDTHTCIHTEWLPAVTSVTHYACLQYVAWYKQHAHAHTHTRTQMQNKNKYQNILQRQKKALWDFVIDFPGVQWGF